MDAEMRERLARLETTQSQLVETTGRMTRAIERINKTLAINQENRDNIRSIQKALEAVEDRLEATEQYVRSRWYVLVAVASSIAAIATIVFNVLT